MTGKDLAARVRTACIDAAIEAYEDAGIQGICLEGRWEAAVAAIRRLDLEGVVEDARDAPDSGRGGG